MNRKIINTCYVLLAALLLSSAGVRAQEKPDSLVNVAFGTMAKKDLLGAVSVVNVTNLLEKDYSISGLNLQAFVGGYTGNIWGQSGLLIIDGVPRNGWDVRITEIESVVVLKGASAVALYGSKAAKGVILVTTKRGENKPLSIDVRANTGLHFPKAYPKYLNAAEYMTLYNEASRNDGIAERYSQSLIESTAAGTNKYRYPDVDYFSSEYLKNAYNRTDVTTEISGGDDFARYYSNFGMVYNNSLMKTGYQAKNKDLAFNVRANIDMNLTDWLTASTNAVVTLSDNYTGRGDFWGTSSTFRPNWFSPLIPIDMLDPTNTDLQTIVKNSNNVIDGAYLLGGTSTDQTNAFADNLAAGYIKNKNRMFMSNVSVGADLGRILKGLTFKTLYSLDYINFYNEAWKEDYAVYQPTWTTVDGKDVITGLTKFNDDKESTSESIGETYYSQTMSFSAQFNYKRTFAEKHNVTAALIGWGYQVQKSQDSDHEGSDYHRLSNANIGMQATYNFMQKYYVDFTGNVVHSAKLPEGKRDAFSPTVTLGWRLSDESFMKDNASFIDNMKLTASYANLNQDIDIENYYMYKGYFDNKGGWYTWRDGAAGGNTTGSKRGDNPNLSFIQRQEFRVGLETSMLDQLVTLDANYFLQYTKGLLTQGASTIYPSYFTNWDFSFLPYLNFNEDKRTGVDFTLNLNKKVGEIDYNLGFSGMYLASEAVKRDEVYQDAYQYRAGKPIDSYWGYISEGLFQDQTEIDNHATQTFGEVKPGDIKYRDMNNDGVIDSKDQVDLGHNGWAASPFTYGVHFTMKWKGFTLFVMGTGNSGAIGFKNSSYYWVKGSSKYSEVVNGRWTETTKSTATYPRLTTTDGSNNFRNSTYWMYKTNRFDLQRVQLTYDLPKEMFIGTFVKNMSVYCSGESLLTLSKERELMEMNVGSAPKTRFVNLGVKASF
jgi:TonB-linked SusC/RagA family outer membrane protein